MNYKPAIPLNLRTVIGKIKISKNSKNSKDITRVMIGCGHSKLSQKSKHTNPIQPWSNIDGISKIKTRYVD